MKRWEYMLATFTNGRLEILNGVKAEDFREMKHPVFLQDLRKPVSAKGTHIVDFLSQAGQSGWEAVVNYGQSNTSIIFKRELEK